MLIRYVNSRESLKIKIKINIFQYHPNLNLIKYVVYINCFELKVISMESGGIKFKYTIKI